MEVREMVKEWNYAQLTQDAKKYGGPEKYVEMLKKYGFQKGVLIMIPICIGGCILSYKKGEQIVQFCKDKLNIVTGKDVELAKVQLIEGMRQTEQKNGTQIKLQNDGENTTVSKEE